MSNGTIDDRVKEVINFLRDPEDIKERRQVAGTQIDKMIELAKANPNITADVIKEVMNTVGAQNLRDVAHIVKVNHRLNEIARAEGGDAEAQKKGTSPKTKTAEPTAKAEPKKEPEVPKQEEKSPAKEPEPVQQVDMFPPLEIPVLRESVGLPPQAEPAAAVEQQVVDAEVIPEGAFEEDQSFEEPAEEPAKEEPEPPLVVVEPEPPSAPVAEPVAQAEKVEPVKAKATKEQTVEEGDVNAIIEQLLDMVEERDQLLGDVVEERDRLLAEKETELAALRSELANLKTELESGKQVSPSIKDRLTNLGVMGPRRK